MQNKNDWKLFAALTAWALLPSVYLLVRMHIVAANSVDINILGQTEWFDLIDEVLVTTLTVPLYSLLKPKNAGASAARNTVAFLLSFCVYSLFAVFVALHVGSIAAYMNAEAATQFLLLQTGAMLIAFVSTFMVLLLTINSDFESVRTLTIARLLLLVLFDLIFIPAFAESGAAYSEMLSNAVVAAASLGLCTGRRLVTPRVRSAFDGCVIWLKQWLRSGVFAGIQIFLDNYIYAVMICKMVNAVSESGNYWVANSFIWGWLLVPVTCFAEIIKKNSLEKLDRKYVWRYAGMIAAVWAFTVPFWNPFLHKAMAVENTDVILAILYPSVLFYLTYIPSAFIDGWFVSRGRTEYLAIISAFVNIVYYGILYLLFRRGVFTASIVFVVQMFGWGMVAHLALSVLLYLFERRHAVKRA